MGDLGQELGYHGRDGALPEADLEWGTLSRKLQIFGGAVDPPFLQGASHVWKCRCKIAKIITASDEAPHPLLLFAK